MLARVIKVISDTALTLVVRDLHGLTRRFHYKEDTEAALIEYVKGILEFELDGPESLIDEMFDWDTEQLSPMPFLHLPIYVGTGEPKALAMKFVYRPDLLSDYGFNATDHMVLIQRKTILDLIASLHDGRLVKQIRDARGQELILLIEGKMDSGRDGTIKYEGHSYYETWGLVFNTLHELQEYGMMIDFSLSPTQTIRRIRSLQEYHLRDTHRLPRFVEPLPDAPDPHLRMLMGIPGIGLELATVLWERFGSIENIAKATPEELIVLQGIGNVRALTISSFLKGDLHG